jgi:cytoskeletal protein RodZ
MDLGSHLRVAREELGLTLEDLSARTKIPRRLLVDLEKNDIARWPKHRVYQVGFLRAYAAEVGLDAEQVVGRFFASCPEPRAEVSVSRQEPGLGGPAPRRFVLGAAIALAWLLVTFIIQALPQDRAGDTVAASPNTPPPAASDVRLEPGRTAARSEAAVLSPLEMSAEPEVEGELLIDSNPSAAWVVVNGIGRGRTPARIRYLPAGSHVIRLLRDGYQSHEQRVTLSSERPVRSLRIILREGRAK